MQSSLSPGGVERLALFLDRSCVALLLAAAVLRPATAAGAGFTDATARLGILVRSPSETQADYGSGAAFADFDGDGFLDLYVVMGNNQPNRLYVYDGDGLYTDEAAVLGCDDTGWGTAVKVADYDNDGDPDIFVANNNGSNRLFNNDGTGRFTDVSALSGLAYTGRSHGGAWGDYDRDGFLDLYVANHQRVANLLYHNNGDGTFDEVAAAAGVADPDKQSYEAIWFDYDGDNDLDLYLSEDKLRGNVLYRNNGGGTFTDVSAGSGADIIMNGMGVAPGDFDNDGDIDVFVTNTPEGHVLLRNNANGTFTDVATAQGVLSNRIGWGAIFFDYDNDADLDLYVVHWAVGGSLSPANTLYRNDGSGFADVTAAEGVGDRGPGFGMAAGDYNGDGAVDLFVVNRDSLSVLYENSHSGNRWLKVRARGRVGNRDGIGARVRVTTGALVQTREVSGGSGYLSHNSVEEEFGLATASTVDQIEVRWPSGVTDTYSDVAVNQTIHVTEGETAYPAGSFMDVSPTVGVNVTPGGVVGRDFGTGSSFVDYDGDGDLDLFVATETGAGNRLYRNRGDGYFDDSAPQAGVADLALGKTVAFADHDNDGDQDFFLATYESADRFYVNDGSGHFTEVAAAAGFGTAVSRTAGACWGDYDADGYLDLFTANYRQPDRLFHNNGDGTFTEVGASAGVNNSKAALVSAWIDYDNDHDLDIFVAVDKDGGNLLYRNEGDGTFTDVSTSAGADHKMNAMGIAVGDYDGNGYMDMYVTNIAVGNALLMNGGDGRFSDQASLLNVAVNKIGWGTAFFDYDNDGDVDLYVVNWSATPGVPSSANNMFRNDGGTFTDVTALTRTGNDGPGFGVTVGDYNNDGTPDMFVNNQNARSSLYEGVPTLNNWIKVKTVGVVSNRDGIGARVRIVTGAQSQIRDIGSGSSYLAHHSPEAEFGVGSAAQIDSLVIRWPSTFVDVLTDVAANQFLTIAEGSSRAPLEYTKLEALPTAGGVELVWAVSWTFGVDGFRIYRTVPGAGDEVLVSGSDPLPRDARRFVDVTARSDVAYDYRIVSLLAGGGETRSDALSVRPRVRPFALSQNYPNPFNPRTTISVTLPERGQVMLVVYDAAGRFVRTIHDGAELPAGINEVPWNGLDRRGLAVASGVYFVRAEFAGTVLTRKMVLLK